MAVFETWLKSDLKKPLNVQKLAGNLFSSDNGGNLIGVEVYDNGSPATLTGGVTGYLIREDGATVMVTGTLSGNRASIVLPASAYIVVGFLSIVIKVGTTTVGACTGYVYRTTTDSLVDPGHVIPSIEELLAQIENCRQATTSANTAASSANSAASNANTKASLADEKAGLANTAASAANAAATKIDGMTVAVSGLAPGSSPTVTISEVSGHKHIAFGLVKGDKGDAGKDFHIAKTFASIAAMMAYTGTDIEAYDFAMIDTGSVEDPDTGKLYCYEPETQDKWQYIGDLSGAQGIKGDTGNGIDHVALNQDYTLTIYFTDGTSYTTTSIRGQSGNETIDDTAGIGDTDLVWSADKTQKELNTKADVIGIVDNTAEAVKTIPDGADGLPMSLTVGIDPVQDLHGYDGPWPAGGNKNQYNKDGTDTTNGYSDGKILNSNGEETAPGSPQYWEISEYIKVDPSTAYMLSGSHETSSPTSICCCEYDSSKNVIQANPQGYASFTFTTSATTQYVRLTIEKEYKNTIQFEKGSSATSYVPYSNVCPISGWMGCNVTRTGKNLYNKNATSTDNGYEYNKYLNQTGELVTPQNAWVVSEYIKINPNTVYTLSGVLNSASVHCCEYNDQKEFVASHSYGTIPLTFTTDSTTRYIRISRKPDGMSGANPYAMLEKGSVASAYEPFGDVYQITFPSSAGTVYGGTLTVNKDGTGTLVVDRANVDLANQSWSYDSSGANQFFRTQSITSIALRGTGIINYISDEYKSVDISTASSARSSLGNGCITITNGTTNARQILIHDDRYTTVETFVTGLTDVQIIVELATPQTYQLSALEVIETLKGINNIFADTGNILSVDYSADAKMYVDAVDESKQEQIDSTRDMIADSDAVIATESHAIGDVFICNNQLIRATDAIAVGETVIIGSNAEVISLSEYIKEQITAIAVLRTDVDDLKSVSRPASTFLLKKLGFTDFSVTYGNGAYVTMKSNVLTSGGGTGTYYYHINLLGTHRIQGGTWGEYTPMLEDFAPIDSYFNSSDVSRIRKFCLRTAGEVTNGGGRLRLVVMKDNGDDTYTYKYTPLTTTYTNLGLFEGTPFDIREWDGIALVLSAQSRPFKLETLFTVEEGDGATYSGFSDF